MAATAAAITGIPRSTRRPRRVRRMVAGRGRAVAGEPANWAVVSVMVSSSGADALQVIEHVFESVRMPF